MLNFYPGPSKIYPECKAFSEAAFESGILEHNHRSEPFMKMLQDTVLLLGNHLNVPQDYKIYFTSSATECWEICAQSLMGGKVQFLFNGAFGKKWFQNTEVNPQFNSYKNYQKKHIVGSKFTLNQNIDDVEIGVSMDVLCLVASETSNGTQTNVDSIKKLKDENPNAVILVDATSSLGGRNHNISEADVWFASSQKCFGMPSGLGIMIVSPRALDRAIQLDERNHYNSLLFIEENFKKFQTNYTPNILGIAILNGLLRILPNISIVSDKLSKRSKRIYSYFEKHEHFDLLVDNNSTRSETVIAIIPKDMIKAIAFFNERGIIIGKGYGEWKETTLRIANFPAIPDEDFNELFRLLDNYA